MVQTVCFDVWVCVFGCTHVMHTLKVLQVSCDFFLCMCYYRTEGSSRLDYTLEPFFHFLTHTSFPLPPSLPSLPPYPSVLPALSPLPFPLPLGPSLPLPQCCVAKPYVSHCTRNVVAQPIKAEELVRRKVSER